MSKISRHRDWCLGGIPVARFNYLVYTHTVGCGFDCVECTTFDLTDDSFPSNSLPFPQAIWSLFDYDLLSVLFRNTGLANQSIEALYTCEARLSSGFGPRRL